MTYAVRYLDKDLWFPTITHIDYSVEIYAVDLPSVAADLTVILGKPSELTGIIKSTSLDSGRSSRATRRDEYKLRL